MTQNHLFLVQFAFFAIPEIGIVSIQTVSVDDFLTLSLWQKEKLDELSNRVRSELPHEYMKKEVYLVRWLRDADFDVNLAEQKLLADLKWRTENQMDSILKEDWSEYAEDYKWYADGCDKEGKPVGSIYSGDWDIRKEVVAGKMKKLLRYGDMVGEEASLVIRKMMESGQNATQYWLLLDMKNFNLVQHGCPNCIVVFLNMLNTLQRHYPGHIHKLVMVNAPQYFLPILDIFNPLMSKELKSILSVFSRNKKKWQNELFKEIDPEQLSSNFGGMREEATDLEDIRSNNYLFLCPKRS